MVIACLGVRFTKMSLRWQTRNKKNNFAETLFRSLYASQPVVRVKNGMALPGSCFWARVHGCFSWFLIAKLTLSAKLGCPITGIGSSDYGIWGPQWGCFWSLSEAVSEASVRLRIQLTEIVFFYLSEIEFVWYIRQFWYWCEEFIACSVTSLRWYFSSYGLFSEARFFKIWALIFSNLKPDFLISEARI